MKISWKRNNEIISKNNEERNEMKNNVKEMKMNENNK